MSNDKILEETCEIAEVYSSETASEAIKKMRKLPFFGDFDIDVPILYAFYALKTYHDKYGDILIDENHGSMRFGDS